MVSQIRMSASDFELAWVLRPQSWGYSGLKNGRTKDKARRILVNGENYNAVCDTWDDWPKDETDFEYVGESRLRETCHQVWGELFTEWRIG